MFEGVSYCFDYTLVCFCFFVVPIGIRSAGTVRDASGVPSQAAQHHDWVVHLQSFDLWCRQSDTAGAGQRRRKGEKKSLFEMFSFFDMRGQRHRSINYFLCMVFTADSLSFLLIFSCEYRVTRRTIRWKFLSRKACSAAKSCFEASKSCMTRICRRKMH